MFQGFSEDVIDRFHHRFFLLVKGWSAAKGIGKIRRTDVDHSQSINFQDFLKVIQSLFGFDHSDGEDMIVGMTRVVGTRTEHGADGAETALPLWRVITCLDKSFCVFTGIHHRTDDSINPCIEHPHDDSFLQPWNPGQRNGIGGSDCLEHADCCLVVGNTMLKIDRQRIPTLMRHDFCRKGTRDGKPAIHHTLSVLKNLKKLIFAHFGSELS